MLEGSCEELSVRCSDRTDPEAISGHWQSDRAGQSRQNCGCFIPALTPYSAAPIPPHKQMVCSFANVPFHPAPELLLRLPGWEQEVIVDKLQRIIADE